MMKKLILSVTVIITAGYFSLAVAQFKIAMSDGIIEFKELRHLEIEGYDGNEVIIETSGEYKIPERAKGLRPINSLGLTDNTGVGLSVKEESKGYQIVHQIARNDKAKYRVKVPGGVKVKYHNSSIHGKDFHANKITNELEVKTHGGDIRLEDITGPLSVSSVHGDIDVIFTTITTELPSSIATVHGDVDVTLPKSANADLNIATTWGEVYSNLDIKIDQADDMKAYRSKKIQGKLNNGGVAMSLSSTHGNVYLRSKE